jgi:hypothetical protein
MKNSISKMFCMMITAFLLFGCVSGTKLVADWRDDAYQGPPSKVFVIGASTERGPRSLVEDEFVRLLKKRGIDSVASYPVLPAEPKPDKDTVLAKVHEAGADMIMVVRFLRKDTSATSTPVRRYAVPQGFDTSWEGIYGGTVADVGVRDVAYDYDVISMETLLYQTETGKPIWSGLSQTTYQGGPIKQIKPFADSIIKELVNAKIIR